MSEFHFIASDLSHVDCGCGGRFLGCPNMRDGDCHFQADMIEKALVDARRAGRLAQAEEDAGVADSIKIQNFNSRTETENVTQQKEVIQRSVGAAQAAAAIRANAAKIGEGGE